MNIHAELGIPDRSEGTTMTSFARPFQPRRPRGAALDGKVVLKGDEAEVDEIEQALAPWTAPRMCLDFAETRHDPASVWPSRPTTDSAASRPPSIPTI